MLNNPSVTKISNIIKKELEELEEVLNRLQNIKNIVEGQLLVEESLRSNKNINNEKEINELKEQQNEIQNYIVECKNMRDYLKHSRDSIEIPREYASTRCPNCGSSDVNYGQTSEKMIKGICNRCKHVWSESA